MFDPAKPLAFEGCKSFCFNSIAIAAETEAAAAAAGAQPQLQQCTCIKLNLQQQQQQQQAGHHKRLFGCCVLQVTYARLPEVQWGSPYQDIVVTVQDTGGQALGRISLVVVVLFQCSTLCIHSSMLCPEFNEAAPLPGHCHHTAGHS
jgi:hypothetical protein